jgi:hypothetical protein
MDKNTITIDGKEYILKSSIKTQSTKAKPMKNMPYVIIRTYSAGVFAGYLEKRVGKEAKIQLARRLWYWKGANSLSELAVKGVKFPAECKFSKPVNTEVTEVIEVLEVSEIAKQSIALVKEWEHD